MSRLYDALRHASRSHQDENGILPQEQEWDLGTTGITGPSISSNRQESAATADSIDPAPPVVPPSTNPWVISPELELPRRFSIPRKGSLGTHAKIALDQRARVIPNIADTVVIEHYRRLRTKVVQQHAIKPFRSLVVTSANPQEGKTVTVLNLALSFAMLSSFKVAVVDGDLRRGSLGKWIGVDDRPGLSNLIEGSSTLEEVVYKCDEIPIHFIVSGTSTLPAAELLHSPLLGSHLQKIMEQFDLVLVDSPPLNLITDTQLLAANCDAVLLVARAFSTKRTSFEKAVQELQPFRVIGTVLNCGAHTRLYGGYY